jgi:hypothetical protein
MLDWPAITDRVIVASVAVAAIYNVAAGMLGGGDATISARLQHHMAQYPVIPMVIGMLAAHWCWPVRGIRE